ncbi:putative lipoprotein [Methylococcus capsulatus str. Bath]|jgi:lipid-binding SYLF domain-containing protein|uniref:Putative lipoprotein n=1 Tax=Methylococcus capsulatus (strain ATCC 33009 / NCIMB 11132 / Bath) TaxID=243233 RepID=Q607C2_METCA|nr:YSC84-related protein [Methylococcus capsulatus]AAU91939.1 putative lipoprotein [Methylococcus capsulatus str. Bath]
MTSILRSSTSFAVVMIFLSACASQPLTHSEKETRRAEIRSMANQMLAQLYQSYPEAKARVRNSAGYAVFSDFGMKILFGGGSHGEGVAINNANQKATYMKMLELSPGLGFGAQKFRAVFLFDTRESFDKFVNSGWEFGGNTEAALQTTTQGAGGRLGVTVSPGVTMYHISEAGAIVGISLAGAKYYKNDELNN